VTVDRCRRLMHIRPVEQQLAIMTTTVSGVPSEITATMDGARSDMQRCKRRRRGLSLRTSAKDPTTSSLACRLQYLPIDTDPDIGPRLTCAYCDAPPPPMRSGESRCEHLEPPTIRRLGAPAAGRLNDDQPESV